MIQLTKAQNTTTIVFILLMVLNMAGALSLNVEGAPGAYIKAYGIHLSIILSFYFISSKRKEVMIPGFKLILLLSLLLLWNAIITGITYYSWKNDSDITEDIMLSVDIGNIMIAGGIVWLFGSNDNS